MAYDEELAERVRELLAGEAGLTEKKMFGGLGFMVGGNMAVAASGQGGLLVRVDPSASYDGPGVEPMVMRGKEMSGWLRVESDVVGTKKQLSTWVQRGVAYARSLPPK
jgi:TfoX/Sxy family transcriptional regulator of competence genes